jgi:Zn-dependent protease with chaperone function
MNVRSGILSGLLITSSFVSVAGNHGVYYSELKAFKKDPATKEMFDKDAHSGLASIQCDIITHKNLTFFQRFVRSFFFMFDVIVATPETLPTLHQYVDGLCKKAQIETPTIFVTRKKWLFNAAAQKLLMSSGAIIIGQKLMHDVSDDALEAIVAHEIGHIKYNHVNKNMALKIARDILSTKLCTLLGLNGLILASSQAELQSKIKSNVRKQILLDISLYLALWWIMDKRFEKEADAFACDNGKSKGLIEFFELTLEKEQLREEEFVAVYELLQQNAAELSLWSNATLRLCYYLAKGGHLCGKAFEYIYHNTPLGAHPSSEERIAAAQKYLQQEA